MNFIQLAAMKHILTAKMQLQNRVFPPAVSCPQKMSYISVKNMGHSH